MVGVPGKYKGCETCRARRVKCDNSRPKCRKCINNGRHCAGYERERVFITATVDDGGRCSSHPPRQLLSSTKRKSESPESPANCETKFTANSLGLAEPLGTAWDEKLTLSNDGHTYTLRLVVLNTDLQAVIRRVEGESSVFRMILPPYKPPMFSAVESLQDSDICSQSLIHLDPNIAADGHCKGILMMLFEHSASTHPEFEFQGIPAPEQPGSVQNLGPGWFQEFPAHHYFVRVFRQTSVMGALISKKTTFLSSKEWCVAPWQLHPKSPLDYLLDILVFLPATLIEVDSLAFMAPTLARRIRGQEILQTCLAIETQLDSWYAQTFGLGFGDNSTGAVWVKEPTCPSAIPPVHEIPFTDFLMFKDGAAALDLLTYWTALIILHSAIDEVFTTIWAPVLDNYPDLYPDLPPNLLIDISRYQQRRGLAAQICRGLDFALNAGVQPDALVPPLVVASTVYREINAISRDGEFEAIWCEGFKERLAAKGQEMTDIAMGCSWTELQRW